MVDEFKYECIWNPQKDITTYELAKCLPYTFSKLHDIKMWDTLDKSITRNFKVSKFEDWMGDMELKIIKERQNSYDVEDPEGNKRTLFKIDMDEIRKSHEEIKGFNWNETIQQLFELEKE